MASVIKYILTFIRVSCIWRRPVARISHPGDPKITRGSTFLNTILDVCSNREPKMKWGAQILNVRGGHHWSPAGDGPELAASPLATSSAEIISQQIYLTQILINDLMKLLKQDEKVGRFSSSLCICHSKAMTALVEYGTRCLYYTTNFYSVLIVRFASWLKPARNQLGTPRGE